VFLGLALLMAIVVPLNVYIDIYGVFRPASGRAMSVYGEERVAKYLHSFRYIAENFDGVLLGSSTSDNLDTRAIRSHRIYNASIAGGNMEDLQPIAHNVLADDRVKIVLFCIHHYLTQDHVRKTGYMTSRDYWAAFGSPLLLTTYISSASIRLGVTRDHHDGWGTYHFNANADVGKTEGVIRNVVASIRSGSRKFENYDIDPIAFQELKDTLAEARRPGRRIVIYYPPVPAPILTVRSEQLSRYRAAIGAILLPTDIVVDFNTPTYGSFRLDLRNYDDHAHLSKAGAAMVVAELDRVLARSDSTLTATK
jgi:hypothetical protein